MTKLIADLPYVWPGSNGGAMMQAAVGASCDVEISLDAGLTFAPAGSLPLVGGQLQALVNMRNCVFKVVNVVGEISVKPDVSAYSG